MTSPTRSAPPLPEEPPTPPPPPPPPPPADSSTSQQFVTLNLDIPSNSSTLPPPTQNEDIMAEFSLPSLQQPPPPPAFEFKQPVILYQSTQPEVFFNPELLFNQREFIMRPGLEYVLLIYGSTETSMVDNQLIAPSTLIHQSQGQLMAYQNNEAQVLCLLVKSTLPDVSLMVPVQTPLSFLLKATQLQIKMHSIPVSEAERCKEVLINDWQLNDVPPFYNASYRLVMFYDRPRRSAPYHVPEQGVGNHPRNLLMRRYPY